MSVFIQELKAENMQLRTRVAELEKVLLSAEDELAETNEHLINRIAEGELVTVWQKNVNDVLSAVRAARKGGSK